MIDDILVWLAFLLFPTLTGFGLIKVSKMELGVRKKAAYMLPLHIIMLLGLLFGFVWINEITNRVALWEFCAGCLIGMVFQSIANRPFKPKQR